MARIDPSRRRTGSTVSARRKILIGPKVEHQNIKQMLVLAQGLYETPFRCDQRTDRILILQHDIADLLAVVEARCRLATALAEHSCSTSEFRQKMSRFYFLIFEIWTSKQVDNDATGPACMFPLWRITS